MSKQETKQALLEIGMKLIFQQGYNHTGLNEVLEAANIPKGSFYYYFSSKEDFGLQALDYFIMNAGKRMAAYLNDETVDPLSRLRNYYGWYAEYLESLHCSQGCMIGNLGQELSDQNEAFRLKIDETMTRISDKVAECLRAAQAAGQINAELDVDTLADFCYNGWQGALLRMKVTKTPAPLHTFINTLFAVILKP